MAEVVLITHRIPYPPNKGDKIRSFNFLKYLSVHHEVHLGTFIDDPDDNAYIQHVRKFCASLHVVELDPRLAKLQSLIGLASGQALTVGYYRSRQLRKWLAQVLAERPVAAVIASSSGVGQYGMRLPVQGMRRIMDFVDVDSDKWLQYARGARWPMRWLYEREGRKLAREERRIAEAFDASIFVSKEEAALFSRQAPQLESKTYGISNGVDADFFNPERDYTRPYHDSAPTIVFTGMMDYRANVEGVLWFARRVFPLIKSQCAGVKFYIVGARPARVICELGKDPDIRVTGKVPDVRPYIAHAHMAVAPLQIARGIQNKVLEALAMGKPVIGTPQAFEGIRRAALLEAMTAAKPDDLAHAAQRLLTDRNLPRCDPRLRAFVRENYVWERNLAALNMLIEGKTHALSMQDATRVPIPPTVGV